MPDGNENQPVAIKVLGGIGEISAEAWDACAGTNDPFVSHGFLAAVEDSGSASAETGWGPRHLCLEDKSGALIGAVPMYLKGHSYGEYVFDWGWGEAYERAGGHYYPKLQAAIPFTPVTGPRLLVRDSVAPELRPAVVKTLAAGLVEVAKQLKVSSVHVTFPTKDQWLGLGAEGFLQREGKQFFWHNPGYGDFDDFLDSLASRKRKMIRRERRDALASGIQIETLNGCDILAHHWDNFFEFYLNTANRKWGHPYLNRDFFDRLGQTMADKVVLVMAERDGVPIAGALNLVGDDALYGRNWGCVEYHPFLHFEVCYYRAMDFAIERGLLRVEAGAGGRHKIQRGYVPAATYSAHWIRDPGFRQAVEQFLNEERREIEFERHALGQMTPFRKDGSGQIPPGQPTEDIDEF